MKEKAQKIIELYTRGKRSKKWHLSSRFNDPIPVPLSDIHKVVKEEGAYYTKRTSKKLVYCKHLKDNDIKVVYSDVSFK